MFLLWHFLGIQFKLVILQKFDKHLLVLKIEPIRLRYQRRMICNAAINFKVHVSQHYRLI